MVPIVIFNSGYNKIEIMEKYYCIFAPKLQGNLKKLGKPKIRDSQGKLDLYFN
ncbi:hypothetical protein DSBG_4034 [Desulfosporosinus sp. BG]|nr:hypothetical protein DSBG_4034 [Desulfosporosinus sp. BG]